MDTARWVWYTLLAHRIDHPEHINLLEVRAALLGLRWRTRSAKRIFSRFVHLLDSQVALSVLVKGRSSSRLLNELVKKVAALTLAGSMMPTYGYVSSTWNPSDAGSRKWEKAKGGRSSWPRRARKPTVRSAAPKLKSRRNQKYSKRFDSTRGYPGEGPGVRGRKVKHHEARRQRAVARDAERFPARRTQLERYLARRGFNLRSVGLSSTTRRLYREAFEKLWAWVGRPPPIEVLSIRAYDSLVAEYICRAWEAGATRGEAGNVLSGSIAAYPELRGRGKMPESWYLLNCWSRLEVPCRAPPLPALVVLGIAHYFSTIGEWGALFLVLAGFDGFLRTRELLSLTFRDVKIDQSGGGVISLAHTKVGQQNAAFEASVMLDPLVSAAYARACAGVAAGTSTEFYIFPGNEARFYKLFNQALTALGLDHMGFRPYSLRRGGATAFYRATCNMAATIERGRWATIRVARIYINDGLSFVVGLILSFNNKHAETIYIYIYIYMYV